MTVRIMTHKQLLALAKRQAQRMVGCPLDEALRKLDAGELDGTLAEAELSCLRFMLWPPRKEVKRRRKR